MGDKIRVVDNSMYSVLHLGSLAINKEDKSGNSAVNNTDSDGGSTLSGNGEPRKSAMGGGTDVVETERLENSPNTRYTQSGKVDGRTNAGKMIKEGGGKPLPGVVKSRVGARGALLVEAANIAVEQWMIYSAGADRSTIASQKTKLDLVIQDINEALTKGYIPQEYQNNKDLGKIINVVLFGDTEPAQWDIDENGWRWEKVDNSPPNMEEINRDMALYKIGKKIIEDISMVGSIYMKRHQDLTPRTYPSSGEMWNVSSTTDVGPKPQKIQSTPSFIPSSAKKE